MFTKKQIADYCRFDLHPLSNLNSDAGLRYQTILNFVIEMGLLKDN